MSGIDAKGRLALRHRLALRFGLVLCLGVAALFVALAWWNVSTQRRHMVSLTEQAAERASSLIRSATRDGMLHDDPERVARVIETIAASGDVRSVRIVDREGRVRHAAGPGSSQETLPIEAFQCQICHAHDPVPSHIDPQRRMREIEGADRASYLNVVEPIPNEPDCWTGACHEHPEGRRILGLIDIELPLAEMNALLQESETQLGFGFLVTLVALVVLALVLTWRWVLRPVQELAVATERVGQGDLTTRVPVTSPDEIGLMAGTWNAMVAELQRARRELENWSQTLEHRVEEKTTELEAAHRRMIVVEKMAALGKLAAVVAHEINNPLAGIATYARLMRKRFGREESDAPEDATETLKALELMEAEAARCGKIVRNLLLFSRTPGARFAEEDLAPIVERCALLVRHQAELQEVDFRVRMADGVKKVVCDASQIQQVILALVMNSIEAMPTGGTLTLSLCEDPHQDGVVLQVQDTGCGIPDAALPHIFEPFFTTKEQGEGVGLGLSVVYGIVDRHRGRVEVDSKADVGTTFRIHLPRRQPPRANGGEEIPSEGDVS